eukprot:5687709-Amphidinium_carterae.1
MKLWVATHGQRELSGRLLLQKGKLNKWVVPESGCVLVGQSVTFQGVAFMDGAALHPNNSRLRRATWSVVQLAPRRVAAGFFPGSAVVGSHGLCGRTLCSGVCGRAPSSSCPAAAHSLCGQCCGCVRRA